MEKRQVKIPNFFVALIPVIVMLFGGCRQNIDFLGQFQDRGSNPSLSAERAGQKWSANGQKATNQ